MVQQVLTRPAPRRQLAASAVALTLVGAAIATLVGLMLSDADAPTPLAAFAGLLTFVAFVGGGRLLGRDGE